MHDDITRDPRLRELALLASLATVTDDESRLWRLRDLFAAAAEDAWDVITPGLRPAPAKS